VFKTKIKRFEFTTNIILIAFFAITGAVMLVSAYGAACVAWDPAWYDRFLPMPPPGAYMFAHIRDNLLLYQASNIITWIFGFAWGGVIYGFLTARKWAFVSALASSAVGFIFGIIPALMSDTKAFTEPFEGIGSPHWGRTLLNLLVLILLVAVYLYPATRQGIKNFTSKENRMVRSLSTQLTTMSLFFFFLAFMSFIMTGFLADAHVVEGINVWQTIELQFMGGVAITIVGSTMLSGGLILHFARPTPKISKAL
jgi:magnesium-transporting ATPase (P-type)